MKATLSHPMAVSLQRRVTLPQSWVDWLALGTVAVVALFAFSLYPAEDQRRWGTLGLLLLFLAAQSYPPEIEVQIVRSSWREHLRLAFLTLLTLGMVALQVNFTAVIILYFILSGRALFLFPDRVGYAWVFLLGGLTTAILGYLLSPNWMFGLLNGFGTTCGYLFVGSAANAQRRAEVANTESKRLLQELQTAHQQLQAYAARAEVLAVAEERNRLAREMHDTLGHRLTVAAVQLEGAQKLVERDPAKAIKMIGTVREQVREGLNELRSTVAALRTPLEEELPLRATFARLATNFMEATGLQTEFVFPGTLPDLPLEHRQTLYRAAQEALTNIQRHARAKHAWLAVTLSGDKPSATSTTDTEIQLAIEDDGIGIAELTSQTGYGLRGLEERATQLGGTLLIHRRPAGGTRLMMRIPLPLPVEAQPPVPNNGVDHGRQDYHLAGR